MDVTATATTPIPAPTPAPVTGPGKSAQSTGHLAKAAVAEVRAGGIELPKNAQGKAASAIAQGADPASVFAAVTEPAPVNPPAEPPTEGTAPSAPDPAETGAAPAPDAAPSIDEAETGYAEAGAAISQVSLNEAETALELLQQV